MVPRAPQHKQRHVFDVDQRPPGGPVALQANRPKRDRRADEVVENDVEAQSRRNAVRRRKPQEDRREIIRRQLRERLLGPHLRRRVCGQRRQWRRLVDGHSSSDAPYMLHEDANTKRSIPAARASSASRTPARWLMSYVSASSKSPRGSFDSAARCTIASIPRGRPAGRRGCPDGSPARAARAAARGRSRRTARVEPDHRVAGGLEHAPGNRSDVTVRPCEEERASTHLGGPLAEETRKKSSRSTASSGPDGPEH